MTKYLLTNEYITHNGVTMYRIQATRTFGLVKKGTLGGFIENENNLSQKDNSWVWEGACFKGTEQVLENTQIFENESLPESKFLIEVKESTYITNTETNESGIEYVVENVKHSVLSTVKLYMFGDVLLYKNTRSVLNGNIYA